MKFPRKASADADARAKAVDRLEEARDEQRRLSERRDGAAGAPAEAQAAVDLTVADEQVAAREAWARWASDE
jgi:high-affinity K+ transport system ATPase subunit B